MKNKKSKAEEVILDVMSHFGYLRNYQVAKYFEVTPQTLSGWIKTGKIPPKHLMKYNQEVLGVEKKVDAISTIIPDINQTSTFVQNKNLNINKFSLDRIKSLIIRNIKIIYGFPIFFTGLIFIYVNWITSPIFTSVSKVLPISEDATNASSFSGMAAQLGINMPISIGGTVPWAEVYPEIVKSSALLSKVLSESYNTKKYGRASLSQILIKEFSLTKYKEPERKNRLIVEFRNMINITKDRLSPLVTLEVSAFEPLFSAQLSSTIIQKSGEIQRELKTNRVKQKRLFIEERLIEVSTDMKKMAKELREFREYNRNLSNSPSLEMKFEEMKREIELQNNLYITLRTQLEKAKIDEVERDHMVQIIDGPNVPAKLTSPKKGLSIVLSMFFGFFISIFTIFFRENYIKTEEE